MGRCGTNNAHPVLRRAERKRLRRTIRPGDVVTWGLEVTAAKVLEVEDNALIVDAWQDMGIPRHRVEFWWRPRRTAAPAGCRHPDFHGAYVPLSATELHRKSHRVFPQRDKQHGAPRRRIPNGAH
jgi:hypothetical protein